MHRIIVTEKAWVDEGRFLRGLNFAMLLPGPESHQLAVYLGWLLNGTRGGLTAGALFILPGFVAMLALSAAYAAWGSTGIVAGLFFGLKAAVLAIVLQALVRIAGRALTSGLRRWVAGLAFAAMFLFGVPFPLVILGAGLVGWLAGRGAAAPPTVLAAPTRGAGWGVPAMLLVLWLAPVAALLLMTPGPDRVFAQLGVFFSQMAVVTFGGAYAVLAWVAQVAVETHGWLGPGEMLDGLGLAEATPGPLIMVVQFVGFLAAFRDPGGLDPWLAGVLGSVLVTWVTFVPSFLWVLAAAPYVERLHAIPALGEALGAITAAVVGVILNLALWFALHVVFAEFRPWSDLGLRADLPVWSSLDVAALVLVLAAVVAVFRFGLGMGPVLAVWAALGLAWTSVWGA
jgi:chromate transporter